MEYGGYLPLELRNGREYFDLFSGTDVMRLNSGRSAIIAALDMCRVNRVFIPCYNCHVVEAALTNHGYCIVKYNINEDFYPIIDEFDEDDWLVYIDYFGICKHQIKTELINKYGRVIFDNTQAFFAPPILQDNVFNVYSCRKFFGVADGAYLLFETKNRKVKEYPKDNSWERSLHLLKSIEMGTNAAYQDSLLSEDAIGFDVKMMSELTWRIMKSIDYDMCQGARRSNFLTLNGLLYEVNELNITLENDAVPMVYPLLVFDSSLREKLVADRIYVPQWWKYLLKEKDVNYFGKYLSEYLIPIPIDQRYNEKDMRFIANLILKHVHKNEENMICQ